ncbi:MAG TPA: alpha/beta hydrolase [Dehalococcoidia bacterium]|nr:alpha/beta hydrolase [Dehalococcoidia bacterium]
MGDRAFNDGFVTANGIRLHYVDWGGDGPPALLLHPTSFHAHVWTPYVRRLQPRFHCYGLDSRGHGDSDKPGSYGWPDFQADLTAFMHALGLRGVLGIGHSAGGTMISLAAAEEPDLVAAAVLLDPILFLEEVPRPATSSDSGLGAGARKRRMNWPSREAILQSYRSRPPFDAWDREFLEDYVNFGVRDEPDGTVTLKCKGEDEAEMYRWGPRRLPSEQVLPRMHCPVLLVTGAQSDSLPPAKAQRAAELLANGELLTLPDSGHFVPFERPAVVMQAIDRFVQRTLTVPPAQGRDA